MEQKAVGAFSSGGGVNVLNGERFGRWTVLSGPENTDGGERTWLCRCDCGTQRRVPEKTLLVEGSENCGCLKLGRLHGTNAYDLTGRVFGDLTVLRCADHQGKNGGVWWTCRCSCGREYDCPATLLVMGKRTHCGCKTRRGRLRDITGQKFGRLTVLHPLEQRDDGGSVIWHCRCDCGNEIDVSYNRLVYGNQKSCGCRKREHDQQLQELLTYVDGTLLDLIRSRKLPRDNTTGCKGVYLVKGRYQAKIVFQKKQYYLGVYQSVQEAAQAREKVEEALFGAVDAYYERYRHAAMKDPAWARANPVHIRVAGRGIGLHADLLPLLPQDGMRKRRTE